MFTGSIIFIMYWLTVLWKNASHSIYPTHVSCVVRELHDSPRCFCYCIGRVVHVLICERVPLLDLRVTSYWFTGWILEKLNKKIILIIFCLDIKIEIVSVYWFHNIYYVLTNGALKECISFGSQFFLCYCSRVTFSTHLFFFL